MGHFCQNSPSLCNGFGQNFEQRYDKKHHFFMVTRKEGFFPDIVRHWIQQFSVCSQLFSQFLRQVLFFTQRVCKDLVVLLSKLAHIFEFYSIKCAESRTNQGIKIKIFILSQAQVLGFSSYAGFPGIHKLLSFRNFNVSDY